MRYIGPEMTRESDASDSSADISTAREVAVGRRRLDDAVGP
jgi:hypothetical protein